MFDVNSCLCVCTYNCLGISWCFCNSLVLLLFFVLGWWVGFVYSGFDGLFGIFGIFDCFYIVFWFVVFW
jgi:hypothetical protein